MVSARFLSFQRFFRESYANADAFLARAGRLAVSSSDIRAHAGPALLGKRLAHTGAHLVRRRLGGGILTIGVLQTRD